MIAWVTTCLLLMPGAAALAVPLWRSNGEELREHRTSNVQRPTSNEDALTFEALDTSPTRKRGSIAAGAPSLARRACVQVAFVTEGVLAATDNDEAVQRGGSILGRGWVGRTHPFYDPQTDDVRLIPPSQPPATTTPSSFSFDPKLIAWIVFIVLAIILVLALIFFLRRMRSADVSTGGDLTDDLRRLSDVDRIEALPFRVPIGQGDLLSQATELYRQGRFADAIVLLFSYYLVEMDKRQLIRLTKGKTNRQYLREIGRRRSLRDLVERTMVAFEAVFFGHHPLDREGFEACWAQVAEFQRLVEHENL